jgi:hypothetical protein
MGLACSINWRNENTEEILNEKPLCKNPSGGPRHRWRILLKCS